MRQTGKLPAEGRGGRINGQLLIVFLRILRGYFSCQKVRNRNKATNQPNPSSYIVCLIDHFLQKSGISSTRTVNISSLPIHMQKTNTSFPIG
ncbi:MAG: hypothetical protein C5S49_06985 [Candidatus Methanogaster sp.]|nr:MAG: hypothetical protein C5S49_06985 [ANME-2 cluster archaeon]